MWTCTLLFSYLADMLRTPPCQRRAWHVQPCIISVIGIGPFYSRTWRTWQTLQEKKKKKQAAIVIAPNEFFPSRRKAACVGLTGKPIVSKRSQLETADRLTPVNRMVGAGADLLACLIWQLMVLMESVGAWLELIGPDGAKYALESLRIYFFIHPQCKDLGVGLSCAFIIFKEILHHWRDGPMHKTGLSLV